MADEKWIIVVDVDLQSPLDILDEVVRRLKDMEKIGEEAARASASYYINFTKEERELLGKRANRCREEVQNIVPSTLMSERQKRGLIGAGGLVLKFLFGTPDSGDLHQLQALTKHLDIAKQELVHTVNHQASVPNATYNMFRNQREMLNCLTQNTRANCPTTREAAQHLGPAS